MIDQQLAELLHTARRHVTHLVDWRISTAHVELHITGHAQQDGWHTFDRDVVESWAVETAAPGQLRLRVVSPPETVRRSPEMSDPACPYCGQRITDPNAVAWHGRDAYHHDGCQPAAEAETDREGRPRTRAHRKLIEAARERHHQDGECEIDGDAVVSEGNDGAYVQAWLWVPPRPHRAGLSRAPGPAQTCHTASVTSSPSTPMGRALS